MVRLLITAGVLGYLTYVLHRRESHLTDLYQQWRGNGATGQYGRLALLIPLGLLNWSLEALKWQLLARKIAHIRWNEAFQGVLAGLALGFVTPNTLGDYAARLWMLDQRNRLEAVGAVMLGRVAQLYSTLLVGLLALVYFARVQLPARPELAIAAIALCAILLLAGVGVALNRRFVRLLPRFRVTRPLARYLRVLETYRPAEVFAIAGLSLLRYGVFSGQFFLLLRIFGISLPPLDAFTGIALVYLAKSVVPALHFLSDLGVREVSALYIFDFYHAAPAAVLAATLSLWLLNMLLPALSGSFLLWRLKIGPHS